MLTSRWVAALALVAVTACNPFKRNPAVEIDTGAIDVSSRWNAVLSTPSGLEGVAQVRGEAWLARTKNGRDVRAHVSISNATPGAVHPWHVHRGQCGSDLGILGDAADYKPLSVSDDGRASRDATLDIPLPQDGNYYVNVHASESNMQTIVACGNLAPPSE